jgi:hypothetical protein
MRGTFAGDSVSFYLHSRLWRGCNAHFSSFQSPLLTFGVSYSESGWGSIMEIRSPYPKVTWENTHDTGWLKEVAVARQRLGKHVIIPHPMRGSGSVNTLRGNEHVTCQWRTCWRSCSLLGPCRFGNRHRGRTGTIEYESWGICIVGSSNLAMPSEDEIRKLALAGMRNNVCRLLVDLLVITINKCSVNLITNPNPKSWQYEDLFLGWNQFD